MLQTLSIKNVALITNLNIEFNKGFNVFLGETGAGKSIIFDALNFVLGGKADKTLIRSGENEMRVDAVFGELSKENQDSLAELGFEGEEISLSRTLNSEGRSSVRVNGMPTVQAVLKNIGQILVDSYSQHESVELLKAKNHLAMLDKFGGEEILNAKTLVQEAFQKEKEISKRFKELGGDEFERERMKSLLEYQISEISDANLQIGEDDELQEKIKFMSSAEKIFEAITACEELLSDSSSACVRELQQSSNLLSSLLSFEEIAKCKERLDSARYEIEDISQTLSDIKASSEYDEREFDRLDRRLDLIKSIIKKYGGSIENALKFLEEAKEKLNNLSDSEFLLAKLEKERKECLELLEKHANTLSMARQKTALNIESKIINELRQLGMKSSSFEVKIQDLQNVGSNGKDDVEFIFSANKGQELKSLSKTASGGELSRFMLAVKTIFSQIGGAQTLVFDEIDSGISGETGNIIGQKINNISSNAQILCITHLPQVACYADAMYFVSKREDDKTTFTEIKQLENQEILTNLAKMVVGDNVTTTALNQAKELREKAGKSV